MTESETKFRFREKLRKAASKKEAKFRTLQGADFDRSLLRVGDCLANSQKIKEIQASTQGDWVTDKAPDLQVTLKIVSNWRFVFKIFIRWNEPHISVLNEIFSPSFELMPLEFSSFYLPEIKSVLVDFLVHSHQNRSCPDQC